jgi:hypothetical protein
LVAGAANAANIAKKKWYWARDAGAPPDEKFGFEIGERESQRERRFPARVVNGSHFLLILQCGGRRANPGSSGTTSAVQALVQAG